MSILDKQTKKQLVLYPMHQAEFKLSTITTRALNEQDFFKLMDILEKEGFFWMVQLQLKKEDKFKMYKIKPTEFNPAKHVNKLYTKDTPDTPDTLDTLDVPAKIDDFNIELAPEGFYREDGIKTIKYHHMTHQPKPRDYISCKKLIK